jgi:hypothetical protein
MRGCCTTCQVTVALRLTAVWLSLAQESLHCLHWTWAACWLGYCWGRTWVLGLKESWSRSAFPPANSGSALTLAESHLSGCGQHLQLSARVPVRIRAISNFTCHTSSQYWNLQGCACNTKWRLSHATEANDCQSAAAQGEQSKLPENPIWQHGEMSYANVDLTVAFPSALKASRVRYGPSRSPFNCTANPDNIERRSLLTDR